MTPTLERRLARAVLFRHLIHVRRRHVLVVLRGRSASNLGEDAGGEGGEAPLAMEERLAHAVQQWLRLRPLLRRNESKR